MSSNEFDIIRRYFAFENSRADVLLGVGDDCALLLPEKDRLLATSVDTLIAGVHFPHETSAADIACKAIAVNISDLVAMAAEPAWLTLALTLPEINHAWLQAFSTEFQNTVKDYGIQLVGGDTTRGPLSITVQVTGFVDNSRVMRRDAAKVGDGIYVTGTLGDAALGLRMCQSGLLKNENAADADFLLSRLNRPEPRLAFALAIAEHVRCAIDISDGLLADLGHIVTASRCGANVYLDKLPLSPALLNVYKNNNEEVDMLPVLSGGDDYELCFTAPSVIEDMVYKCADQSSLLVTKIGEITDSGAIECLDAERCAVNFASSGYRHF